MTKSLSFHAFFTRHEIHSAYAALEESRLFTGAVPFFQISPRIHSDGNASSAQKIEITARLSRMRSSEAQSCVPSPLLRVCRGLESAALDFAHTALRDGAVHAEARAEFLEDIAQRSVFRAWRYGRGVGCRPHCDPGLCTALLRATAPGLELIRAAGAGSPRTEANAKATDQSEWEAPNWKCAADDTIVFSGDMMRVVSGGAVPGILHRVRPDWAELRHSGNVCGDSASESEVDARYSLVLELRPARPRRWYALMQKGDKWN